MNNNNIELLKKIAKAKASIGKVKFGGNNAHFKTKYLCLDDCLEVVEPILNNVGLLVVQTIDFTSMDSHAAPLHRLVTRIYDIDTGEYLESSTLLESGQPQKIGAQITYFRRYHLVALLGIKGTEDDDCNPETNATDTNLWKSEILPLSRKLAAHLNWSEAQRKATLVEILQKLGVQYTDVDSDPTLCHKMKLCLQNFSKN